MRVFWLDIFFKKFCFLTNKYGRPASTETTSLVINAYFIGFDYILEMHKKFVPHDLNHVRLLKHKQNILRDLFINISRIVGMSRRTRAYSLHKYTVPRDLKRVNEQLVWPFLAV